MGGQKKYNSKYLPWPSLHFGLESILWIVTMETINITLRLNSADGSKQVQLDICPVEL